MTGNKHFNIYEAIALAKLTKASYEAFETNPLDFTLELSHKSNLQVVSLISNRQTDTHAFIAKNDTCAFLAFRGPSNYPTNILSDITARAIDGKDDGLFKSFHSIKADVEAGLKKVAGLPLIVTGHSLGGALAKAALLELPQYDWRKCYAFGSPPACQLSAVSIKVPTVLVMNTGDIVSRVTDFKDVPDLLGPTLTSILSFFHAKNQGDERFKELDGYIRQMRPDLEKFRHIGERVYFNRAHRIEDAEEGLNLLRKTLEGDMYSFYQDHFINQYISNLEKHESQTPSIEEKEKAAFHIPWGKGFNLETN